MWLEVPRFVEASMVAELDDTRLQIQIEDILVGGRVPEEYTSEVMAGPFGMPRSRMFYAYPRTKKLQ